MIFDDIQWDDHNLGHATRRLSADEIEQAILNADDFRPNQKILGRIRFRSATDGGKRVVVIAQLLVESNEVRPITAWEDR